MIYISADMIAECCEALRQGIPIDILASKLGVTVDDGLTADVSVFVTQSLEDPPRRVTLLAVNLPIAVKDLFNDRLKRIHDR